jgi:hypothetical protein
VEGGAPSSRFQTGRVVQYHIACAAVCVSAVPPSLGSIKSCVARAFLNLNMDMGEKASSGGVVEVR